MAAAPNLDSDVFNGAGESNADRAVVPPGEKELSTNRSNDHIYFLNDLIF